MKHTPGPWRIADGDRFDGGFQEPSEYEYIVLAERKTPSAIASFWDFDWGDEAQANARLIAAAPDLLEALEMVRDADNDNGRKIPPLARAKIDAAIAKATGD